jgi:filamentous hemagglutinin family protein
MGCSWDAVIRYSKRPLRKGKGAALVILPHARPGLLRCLWLLFLSGCLLLLSLPPLSQAQRITLDGSLGPGGTLSGPNYVIPDFVGQTRGPNLFHSFGQFNLIPGESATFTGPNTIHNIIGRVTGGSQSFINGLLQSQIPGAHLFLLNPSGIVFGPSAQLNVSGSFYVSTADYLRLADGAVFASHTSRPSVLSAAPPAAFGFLTPTPVRIDIVGSTLQVPPGETFAAVGGDLSVQPFFSQSASIAAPGGRISLTSVASVGEVGFSLTDPTVPPQVNTFTQLGRVDLLPGTILDASGPRGGTVVIRGGRLMLDGATIISNTQGNVDGVRTGVDIGVTQDVVVTNNGRLQASTSGDGRAGDIVIQAESLTLMGGGGLFSTSGIPDPTGQLVVGTGAAGNILVTATTSVALGGGSQMSTSTAGGAGGQVHLVTPNLNIDGGSIAAETVGASRAGDIVLEVGRLTLMGGARIDSSTLGAGPGGTVTVTATEMLAIAGRDSAGNPSGLFSTTSGREPGGTLTLQTRQIELSNGGTISASSSGTGDAGDIRIQAGQTFRSAQSTVTTRATQAGGGNITIEAGVVSLTQDSRITAAAMGTDVGSNGGNVIIRSEAIALNHSQVQASASLGHGGTITIGSPQGVVLTDIETCPAPARSCLDVSSLAGSEFFGTVEVRAPVTSISGSVAPLPQSFARAAELLRDRCAERDGESVCAGRPRWGAAGAGALVPECAGVPWPTAHNPERANAVRETYSKCGSIADRPRGTGTGEGTLCTGTRARRPGRGVREVDGAARHRSHAQTMRLIISSLDLLFSSS